MFLSKKTRINNVCGYLNHSFIEMQKRPEQEKREQCQSIIIPNVAGVFEKLYFILFFTIPVHFKRLVHPKDKRPMQKQSKVSMLFRVAKTTQTCAIETLNSPSIKTCFNKGEPAPLDRTQLLTCTSWTKRANYRTAL